MSDPVCDTCRVQPRTPCTTKCEGCWVVELHLKGYLSRSAAGREFVRKQLTLADQPAPAPIVRCSVCSWRGERAKIHPLRWVPVCPDCGCHAVSVQQ